MAENELQKRRLPKARRDPHAFAPRRLNGRDIKIILTIARYRFITSSDIIQLVGGNADVTHRHLKELYHRDLISRMPIPGRTGNVAFLYFLDNLLSLRDLVRSGQMRSDLFDFEQITLNQAKYSEEKRSASSEGVGHLLFLSHEVMISHFRAGLEVEAARSAGGVSLSQWRQGTETWDSISPKGGSGNSMPFRPDAFFTLYFPGALEGQQSSHFFYEADRQTSNRTRFKAKLEIYLQFFLQGHYARKYGARRVRAVLVETTSPGWMEQLKQSAAELARREPLAGQLFWFTTSGSLRAKGVLSPVWVCAADQKPKSLLD